MPMSAAGTGRAARLPAGRGCRRAPAARRTRPDRPAGRRGGAGCCSPTTDRPIGQVVQGLGEFTRDRAEAIGESQPFRPGSRPLQQRLGAVHRDDPRARERLGEQAGDDTRPTARVDDQARFRHLPREPGHGTLVQRREQLGLCLEQGSHHGPVDVGVVVVIVVVVCHGHEPLVRRFPDWAHAPEHGQFRCRTGKRASGNGTACGGIIRTGLALSGMRPVPEKRDAPGPGRLPRCTPWTTSRWNASCGRVREDRGCLSAARRGRMRTAALEGDRVRPRRPRHLEGPGALGVRHGAGPVRRRGQLPRAARGLRPAVR